MSTFTFCAELGELYRMLKSLEYPKTNIEYLTKRGLELEIQERDTRGEKPISEVIGLSFGRFKAASEALKDTIYALEKSYDSAVKRKL